VIRRVRLSEAPGRIASALTDHSAGTEPRTDRQDRLAYAVSSHRRDPTGVPLVEARDDLCFEELIEGLRVSGVDGRGVARSVRPSMSHPF
jgi:hypothetical protein